MGSGVRWGEAGVETPSGGCDGGREGEGTLRGERRPRTVEIPGTAVRHGGDATRPPPALSVTLAKLPPCSGLAWQPPR